MCTTHKCSKILYICQRILLGIFMNILYIHGMGGGSDSRIPSVLNEYFSQPESELTSVRVVCHTYSFDPEIAHGQIKVWIEEYDPDLVIGESLGSLHALRICDRPILLVSPALNTPFFFEILSWLTWIPGVTGLFQRIYRPREGDRQTMTFVRQILKKYRAHGQAALEFKNNSTCELHAFFGLRDHYRRSGVVSIKRWKKLFGETFTLYDGTHFMEEEYIYSLLVPKIQDILNM